MKFILAGLALLAFVLAGSATISEPAAAKGCIKGAIVGGVVGHMAGHGKTGIVAGCVIGHHEAVKKDRERHQQMQQNPARDDSYQNWIWDVISGGTSVNPRPDRMQSSDRVDGLP